MYELIQRDCGTVGWLGVIKVADSGQELYRTGVHCKTPLEAFERCVKATTALDNLVTDETDEQPNLYCECTHQLDGDGLCPMCDIAAEAAE